MLKVPDLALKLPGGNRSLYFCCFSSCCFVVIGWCNSGRIRIRVMKNIIAIG